MPALDGNTHINLTVSDLDRSVRWYCEVFDFVQINDVSPEESRFRFCTLVQPSSLASVVLGAVDGGATTAFDESRIGLHHLAFHVPNRDDLTAWAAHLDELGLVRSEITESPFETGVQIWLRDPDNIWLELYWVNREFFVDGLRKAWRAAKRSGIAQPWSAAGKG